MGKSTKISLLYPSDKSLEIKKHSSLTQISSTASAVGRMLMNVLILIAQTRLKTNENQHVFFADVGVVKHLIGTTDGSNKTLKKELKKLRDDSIEYNIFEKDTEQERGTFGFLSEAKIISLGRGKASILKFEFPDTILQMVKSPNIYVWINLVILKEMESKYGIAMYEFADDYINVSRFHCTVPKFRKLMGIKEHQYKIFTMLEARVLKKGTKEVNEKTDINIDYSLVRKGRKVEAIKFRMKKNTPKIAIDTKEIKEKLALFGFKEKTIERFLENHTQEYLWSNIAVVEVRMKKQKISNIQGYLTRAFQQDFAAELRAVQEAKAEKEESKKAIERAETLKKEELEKLAKLFEQEKQQKIKDILNDMKFSEVEELKKQFLEEIKLSPIISKMYQMKGFEYHGMQSHWYKFLGNQFLPIESNSFEAYKKMKIENGEISI